jgi:hypothetical protein
MQLRGSLKRTSPLMAKHRLWRMTRALRSWKQMADKDKKIAELEAQIGRKANGKKSKPADA